MAKIGTFKGVGIGAGIFILIILIILFVSARKLNSNECKLF